MDGNACTRPVCFFQHPDGRQPAVNGTAGPQEQSRPRPRRQQQRQQQGWGPQKECWHGDDCRYQGCTFWHPRDGEQPRQPPVFARRQQQPIRRRSRSPARSPPQQQQPQSGQVGLFGQQPQLRQVGLFGEKQQQQRARRRSRSPARAPPQQQQPQGRSLQKECRHGNDCRYQGCTFWHPRDGGMAARAPIRASSIPCRFGAQCTKRACRFDHSKPRGTTSQSPARQPDRTWCPRRHKCTIRNCDLKHSDVSSRSVIRMSVSLSLSLSLSLSPCVE